MDGSITQYRAFFPTLMQGLDDDILESSIRRWADTVATYCLGRQARSSLILLKSIKKTSRQTGKNALYILGLDFPWIVSLPTHCLFKDPVRDQGGRGREAKRGLLCSWSITLRSLCSLPPRPPARQPRTPDDAWASASLSPFDSSVRPTQSERACVLVCVRWRRKRKKRWLRRRRWLCCCSSRSSQCHRPIHSIQCTCEPTHCVCFVLLCCERPKTKGNFALFSFLRRFNFGQKV